MFLDIDLIDTINTNFHNTHTNTRFIFLINENNNIKRIFDLSSIRYIFKNKINQEIDLLLENIIKDSINLTVRKVAGTYKDTIFLISLDEINYIKADRDNTILITENGLIYKNRHSLKYWTEKLKGANYFRCHKSFLVNIEKLKEVLPSFNYTFELKFDNYKENVPVGRNYIKEFRDLFGL